MSAVYLAKTQCCGLAEIHWLSSVKAPTLALHCLRPELRKGIVWRDDTVNFLFPFVMFTDVMNKPIRVNYGENLAMLIRENGLGHLIETNPRRNWTGNTIKAWIWEPDYAKLWDFLDANPQEGV